MSELIGDYLRYVPFGRAFFLDENDELMYVELDPVSNNFPSLPDDFKPIESDENWSQEDLETLTLIKDRLKGVDGGGYAPS